MRLLHSSGGWNSRTMKVLLIGVDLAWGEKMHDGVCCLELEGNQGKVLGFGYPHGDRELLGLVGERGRGYEMIFMTVDAPLVCPNRTGTRPVDRLTHRMFHRQHAACHPANTSRCPRPTRVARLLIRKGFSLGWEVGRAKKRRRRCIRIRRWFECSGCRELLSIKEEVWRKGGRSFKDCKG